MSKISLQMYTLRDYTKTPAALDRTLGRLADIGYRVVQPRIPEGMTTEAFRDLLRAHGMRADSCMGDIDYPNPDIEKIARDAEILGTTMVRGVGMPYDESRTLEGMRRYAALLNERGRLLRRYGLTYLYHFHAYEYTNYDGINGMDILVDETDPDAIHFQPDVHWMAAAGVEPSAGLWKFRGRAEYIHLQGYAIIPTPGVREPVARKVCPVGQGNLNWTGIIDTARKIGVTLYVVEMDDCLNDPFDDVRTSFEYLRRMGIE